MKCITCGYETQPGAKFCVQCGTTVVAASPTAGMAPLAVPSVSPRPAAAAPAASPSATAATMTRAAYTPPPFAAPGAAPGVALPGPAAPAAGAPRLGLIAGVLVLIAALGIGSFVAYKMLSSARPKESLITTDAPKATPSPAAQAPTDAPRDAAPSPASNMTSHQAPTPVETAPATTATPVVPQTPDTTKAPAGAPAAARTGTAQPKAGSATGKSAAPMTSAPAPLPAPAPTQQAAAPAAPAPQVDRWELMRQAHEACSRESLFDRLACNHRVGQQYCKGYWGLVPQCPAGAYGDRGNAN